MSKYPCQQGAHRSFNPFILCALCLWAALLACNFPTGNNRPAAAEGLALAPRASDGTVSGSFGYPASLNQATIRFSVSLAGAATFQVDGAPASEQLTVSVSDETTGELTWAGQTLDGYGALSQDELTALQALGSSELWHGLSLIPLQSACQGEDQIEPRQVAALVFPLQMYFKYLQPDRATAARALLALSECMAAGEADNPAAQRLQIYMTGANPIPVVFGYFPFDAEGAVEAPVGAPASRGLMTLLPQPVASAPIRYAPGSVFPVIRDQFGPCEALCRGACGPNCTLNNCSLTADYRCEVDEQGNNTGQISYLHIYECGLHPACIKHDQCYDDCNQRYGCGTFKAAHCRHGGWTFFGEIPDDYYCDLHTVMEEELANVKGWVDGFGPQLERRVFVYTDPNNAYLNDLVNCPLAAAAPTIEDKPTTAVEEENPVLVYEGFVSKGAGQVFDLVDSEVVLEVSGEQVTALVQFTFIADVRWEQNQVLCTATMHRIYYGEGLLDIPVAITLELQSHQDTLQGSDCAGINVPVITTQDLVGMFLEDGSFTGNIRDVWIIDAVQVSE